MIAPSIFYAMILLVRFPFFTIWSVFMNNQSVMIPLKKYQVLPKSIVLNKYKHKTFEERVAEYNGEISVDISHILGNLITVIFDYQILRKPLKILSL